MAKFVSSVEAPHVYVANGGKVLHYSWEKDHLIVEGSVFLWNWDTTFKKAVVELQAAVQHALVSTRNEKMD